MIFYGLDKNYIKLNSRYENGFYVYELGGKIEVLSPKKKHVNNILARSLSYQSDEDKMMVRYYPTNEVFFKEDLIDSDTGENFSSCLISSESCSAFIGRPQDYQITTGILAFSGVLSLNGKVKVNRQIQCNSQMDNFIREKVRILACGLRDDKLYALFYIPSERGLALSCDTGNISISAKSLTCKNYSSWGSYTLDNWFENVRIKEI